LAGKIWWPPPVKMHGNGSGFAEAEEGPLPEGRDKRSGKRVVPRREKKTPPKNGERTQVLPV